jgi:metal-sulfur cluster biosynthetic enzyme
METMPPSSDSGHGIAGGQVGDGHRPPPQGRTEVEERIWEQLRECYDPEIPLNIVDLGLVYGVAVKGNQANVQMTLTSPGCHLGGQIAGNVQEKLLALAEIEEANVELVWDPPWHQSMISEEGRKVLGLEAG